MAETIVLKHGDYETRSDRYGDDYADEFRRVLATYAANARRYLEWGAGYTTVMTCEHCASVGAEMFLTLDDNRPYLLDVIEPLRRYRFLKAGAFGLRGSCETDRDDDWNYSTFPLSYKTTFDFIFIDGRRRLECAFIASLMVHDQSIVVIHDYRRRRYQSITALFEVIEDGSQFRVMRPRQGAAAVRG